MAIRTHAPRMSIRAIDARHRAYLDGFVVYASWNDVLAQARSQLAVRQSLVLLLYWAALDLKPRPIQVKRVYKNGKIRISSMSEWVDDFTVDATNLEYFYRRV